MESCNEHSGVMADLKNATARITEFIENQRRLHARIDDVFKGQDEIKATLNAHKLEIFGKINEYAAQMTEQQGDLNRAIIDPKDGIAAGLKDDVRALQWHRTLIYWLLSGEGVALLFFIGVAVKKYLGVE